MKIGLLLRDLSASQLSWRVLSQGVALAANPLVDIAYFYEERMRPCMPVPGMSCHIMESWGAHRPLVATTLSTAKKLANMPSRFPRIFYVWDLEWLRMSEKSYRTVSSIYRDPSLRLVARTQEYADVIEDCWNVRPLGLCETADISKLYEYTQ